MKEIYKLIVLRKKMCYHTFRLFGPRAFEMWLELQSSLWKERLAISGIV